MTAFLRAVLIIAIAAWMPTLHAQTSGAVDEVDLQAFENRLLHRALTSTEEGRLRDALLAWSALNALRPDNARYRDQMRSLGDAIRSRVNQYRVDARATLARGSHEAAIEMLLKALVLDPYDAEIAAMLREAEASRVQAQLRNNRSRASRP